MATITGPLLSFGARASLGKTVVYSSWKGIAYARRHVVPANPDTLAQQDVRGVFRWLQSVWSYMPAEVQEGWNAYAQGQPLTGRNAIAKFNVSGLQNQVDLGNFVFSPAAKSGPVAASIAVNPAPGALAVDLGAPPLPNGWTIDSAVAAAILDQDPSTGTDYETVAATDSSDPYSLALPGLTPSALYIVGGWFKYVRPDGTFAYGPALMDSGTPS